MKLQDQRTAAEEAAEAYGIDLDLLGMQVKLTPMQRIEAHQKAFELMQTLQQAATHGRHQPASSSTPSK